MLLHAPGAPCTAHLRLVKTVLIPASAIQLHSSFSVVFSFVFFINSQAIYDFLDNFYTGDQRLDTKIISKLFSIRLIAALKRG